MVQLGAPVHPAMNIFVPFTTVQPHTMVAMLWYLHHTQFVDVSGDDWAYVRYFEQRWRERKTFINIEHDVVPGPGVIDSMWSCPHDWCVEDYQGPPPAPPSVANCFGSVKFSQHFIESVPNVWRDYRNGRHETFVESLVTPADAQVGQAWRFLDVYMFDYLQTQHPDEFAPHHHWPLCVHGGKGDAFYAPVRVTSPDGAKISNHPLTVNPIELTLNTL